MAFFHTTPLGRIINRLTKDTVDVDKNLADFAAFFLRSLLQLVSTIVLIGVVVPFALPALLPILLLFYFLYQYFQARRPRPFLPLSFSSLFPLVRACPGPRAPWRRPRRPRRRAAAARLPRRTPACLPLCVRAGAGFALRASQDCGRAVPVTCFGASPRSHSRPPAQQGRQSCEASKAKPAPRRMQSIAVRARVRSRGAWSHALRKPGRVVNPGRARPVPSAPELARARPSALIKP
jgi:hypothetical protein